MLLSALLIALASSAPRPKVDESAMREAIAAAEEEGSFASSASYAHFLRARLAHLRGDHAEAVVELRLALATDENNPFLLHALAEEHARVGDFSRAERALKKLIEASPKYARAHLLMGRVLLEGKKYARARAHLRLAIELAPRDPDPYLVLTQLALENRDLDQAVQSVEALAKALPGETIGHRRLGLVLAERGEYARAEKLLDFAVAHDPHDFEAWVTLAQIYENTGRFSASEEAYSKALEQDPDNREVLLAAGRLALRLESPQRARAYFDRLLLLSDDPELVVKVAFAYLSTRQVAAASDVLDAANHLSADEPRIAFYSGLVRERLRQYERAEQGFARVPAEHELFFEAQHHRANCLSLAGRHAEAVPLLERLIAQRPDLLELHPTYARALERAARPQDAEKALRAAVERFRAPELFEAIAQFYERRGDAPQGLRILTDAVSEKPRDESLLYILGAAYERTGDSERSIEKMRAVLQVNPHNAAAMNFIGYTLAERGRDYDEAERLLKRALELRPDSGEFLDSLGWIYFRRGQFDAAAETLERAERMSPDEPVIIEHLADAYQQQGRRSDAARAYRRALEALEMVVEPAAEHARQRASLERKLKLLSTDAATR